MEENNKQSATQDSAKMTTPNATHTTISHVPRLPEFNSKDPEMWFAIVENYFDILGIVNAKQKFHDVTAALPQRISNKIRDIIVRPLNENSYKQLKAQLIKRLSSSQEEKTRQLLEDVRIGAEKPSQYLRRLQALAGQAVPETLIRTLCLRGLPNKMKPTMATQQDKSLSAIAEVADTVYGLLPPQSVVAEAAAQSDQSISVEKLCKDIEDMKLQISQLARSPDRSRRRSKANNRSYSASPHFRQQKLCWYHRKFGAEAKKCISKNCSWVQGNASGGQ